MDDASLSALVLRDAQTRGVLQLTPAFAPQIERYTVYLSHVTHQIKLTATAKESDAFVQYPKSGAGTDGLLTVPAHTDADDLHRWEWTLHVDAPDGITKKAYVLQCVQSRAAATSLRATQLTQGAAVLRQWHDWPDRIQLCTFSSRQQHHPLKLAQWLIPK